MLTAVSLLAQQPAVFPDTPNTQSTNRALQSKAPADECFAGMGLTTALFTKPPCPPATLASANRAKVNQGYIWAMTEGVNDDLWFGTLSNGQCVTQGGITPAGTTPVPYETDSWICEFANSKYIPSVLPSSAAVIGDFRPPRIYWYNKTTKVTTDVTPSNPAWVNPTPPCPTTTTPCNPEGLVGALRNTIGIRAAATINTATGPIVLLAGTNLSPALGLTFFAYDANTHAFLGTRSFAGYGQIRQFTNVGGSLYTAVGRNACTTPPTATTSGLSCTAPLVGGSILKISAAKTASCANPYANPPTATTPCFTLSLTEVGRTETIGAYLTDYDSGSGPRIYVSTWPDKNLPGKYAGLFMSPTVPASPGLPASTASWTKIWDISQFEPDPAVVNFISGGAVKAFDGHLIWGTLTIPTQAYSAFVKTYCPGEVYNPTTGVGSPCTKDQLNNAMVGTMRSITIFRGKNLDTTPVIDTLYGDAQLPVYSAGAWALKPNKTGKPSVFGPAGFANPWNTYTWNMNVWDNRLWIGTFDWSFMAQQGSRVLNAQGADIPPEMFAIANYGGDMFYMNSATDPAFAESTHGIGNQANFGVRNSLVSGDLFAAMANPMNLLTDGSKPCPPTGGPACLGGWELLQLTPKPQNTPFGQNVTVNLDGGVSATFCNVMNGGNTFSQTVSNPYNPDIPVNPLLQPFEYKGPDNPPGTQTPPGQYILLHTTAKWRQGCSSSTLATVTVPRPAGLVVPRLFQLQWVGNNFAWVDITASVNWTGGTITGNISKDFLGSVAVMDRINYFGQLAGNLVVPPQNNKESGQIHIQAKKNQDPNLAFVNLTTSKIDNFTLADLHWGAPGSNGPVVATLAGPFNPAQKSTSGSLFNGTLSSANLVGPFAGWTIAQFMQKVADGQIYVDIHTTSAPGGYIRAQVQ